MAEHIRRVGRARDVTPGSGRYWSANMQENSGLRGAERFIDTSECRGFKCGIRFLLLICTVFGCASVKDKNADAGSCPNGLISCDGDCIDPMSDPDNCGGCGIACAICDNGDCIAECPANTVECDGNCIDPMTDEDYCGASAPCQGASAGVMCDANEECMAGGCECAAGAQLCGGVCTDVQNDDMHCGTCNNACTGCSGGVCPPGSQDLWEEDFTAGENPTAQCSSFQTFTANLTSGYTSVTLYGSNDMVGITCSQPALVDQIAQGLRSNANFYVNCDGHAWTYCDWLGGELFVDGAMQCDPNNCPSPGYIIRVCWDSSLYGGVNTATCSSTPSQTMGLRFTR